MIRNRMISQYFLELKIEEIIPFLINDGNSHIR